MASSVFWTTLSAIASRGLFLVRSIVMARLLGREIYGQWGIVGSIVSMLAQYSAMGAAKTASKHVAELKTSDPIRCGNVLSFIFLFTSGGLFVMSIAGVVLAKWLAVGIYSEPALTIPLMFSVLYLITLVMNSLLQGVLAGFNDFKHMAGVAVIQGAIELAVTIPLIMSLDLLGAVLGAAASFGVSALLFLRRMNKLMKQHNLSMSLHGAWSERKLFWSYTVPLTLSGGVTVPATWFAYTLTTNLIGFAALGAYVAADRFRVLLLFIPTTMKQVSLPMLSEALGNGNARRFRRVLWASLGINIGIAAVGALPVVIFSPWLLSWFGPTFREEWPLLVILAFAAVVQAGVSILSQVTQSSGRTWKNFIFNSTYAIILVVVALLTIPRIGATGLAWSILAACIASFIAHGVLAVVLMRKKKLFRHE